MYKAYLVFKVNFFWKTTDSQYSNHFTYRWLEKIINDESWKECSSKPINEIIKVNRNE